MCKIVIKEVHGEPKAVTQPGVDWTRWEFTVTASIDDADPVKALVKTFDESVKEKILSAPKDARDGPVPIWEAEPYDKAQTISYTIKAAENPTIIPLKRKRGGKGQAPVKSNRQVALELAYKLAPALAQEMAATSEPNCVLLRQQVFELAEDNLEWLEGESK